MAPSMTNIKQKATASSCHMVLVIRLQAIRHRGIANRLHQKSEGSFVMGLAAAKNNMPSGQGPQGN